MPKKMQSIFFKHYLTQGDQVMKATLTTAKGSPTHIGIYGTLFIVLALLLRGGIVALQPYYRTNIYFLDVGVIVYFGLPLLELGTLIAASWHVSPRTKRIVRIGQFLLPVLIINAAWRVIEYFQTLAACEITSGGYHETFCNILLFQVFVHVPFLFLGTIALFLFLRKIDISHLYKKWAFVIGAALLLRVIFFLTRVLCCQQPFLPSLRFQRSHCIRLSRVGDRELDCRIFARVVSYRKNRSRRAIPPTCPDDQCSVANL